eukprot:s1111_g18.t1
MSLPSANAAYDLEQAAIIINILRESGMWEAAMFEANRREMKSAMTAGSSTGGGAMHDGSKRRSISPSMTMPEDGEFEYIPDSPEMKAKSQKPIPPQKSVQNRRLTYEAMVSKSSVDAELKSYLKWIMTSNMKSAKIDDLKGYLLRVKHEVLDQPLVLSSALSACAQRVAKQLGWRPEDLEAVVGSYARLEPEVKEGLAELQELHRSCLETGFPPALGSKNPWLSENSEQDSTRALQILQDLGERKAQKLAELKGHHGPGLGPRILQLCEEVEQDFWAQLESSGQLPRSESGDANRDVVTVAFGSAVLSLDANGEFQGSYTKLMKDSKLFFCWWTWKPRCPPLAEVTGKHHGASRLTLKEAQACGNHDAHGLPKVAEAPITAFRVNRGSGASSSAFPSASRDAPRTPSSVFSVPSVATPNGTFDAPSAAPMTPAWDHPGAAGTPPMDGGISTPPWVLSPPPEPPVEDEEEGAEPSREEASKLSDAAYFEAYDQMEVHALMLNDSQRLGAYLAAIRAHHLQGKKVLDVGAGSGILSLLAAKHGLAEHVWAVEAVPGMAKMAKQLVEQNGLQDKVTVLNSRVEDAKLPGKEDHFIYRLESVLKARDLFLQPQGLMLPCSARIWAALVESEDLRKEIAGYDDFLGLDLGVVGEHQLMQRMAEPQLRRFSVWALDPWGCKTSPCNAHIAHVHLSMCIIADVKSKVELPFNMKCKVEEFEEADESIPDERTPVARPAEAAAPSAPSSNGSAPSLPLIGKIDKVVSRHRSVLFKNRMAIMNFLEANGFKPGEAVKQNNPQMVSLLLSFGADTLATDHLGRTAYALAKSYKHQEVIEAFDKLGLSPTSPYFKGSKLEQNPPPLGFEQFFADLGKDNESEGRRSLDWDQKAQNCGAQGMA